MRRIFGLALMVILAPAGYSQPQPNPMLSARDAAALFQRSVQLIESTSATVPGLVRAAAPALENARQALTNLETGPAGHSGQVYDLLTNVRAYLSLSDSVPKPFPFPEEARKQFAELRDVAGQLEAYFRASLDQKERQLRSPDRDNVHRYADDDLKLAKAAPGEKRIVFLGDSITDGWRLNEYFPNRDFVNRGIGGQVTSEMLGRMKEDVIDLKPSAVLILAGTNDIARGTPLSTIENNLTMIADLADLYKIKPMFASVLPISDYHKDVNPRYEMTKVRPPASIIELNRWIEAFCKQRRYPYVDYFSKMVDPAGYMKTDLADDGLHPNSAGYRIMGPIAMEAIDKHAARPAVSAVTPPPAVAPTPKKQVKVRSVPTPPPTEPATAPEPPKVQPPTISAKPVKPPKPPKPAPAEPVTVTEQAPKVQPPKIAAKPVKPPPAPKPVPPPKPAPVPAAKVSTDSKPAEKKASADSSTPKTKKKKESFWNRTYPENPPKHDDTPPKQ
jgi:lysophospholipase L1-like esterase